MADRPTERRRLDQMTDDDLDALYAELAQLQAFRDVVYLETEHWDEGSKNVICAAMDEYGLPGAEQELRAERAEQQLATMTAVAQGNRRHVQILTATLDQHAALLAEYVRLADITHKYGSMGGHDCLGANLGCAGCDLRDRTRAALDGAQQPETAGPPTRCPNPAAHVQVRRRPGPGGEGSDQ